MIVTCMYIFSNNFVIYIYFGQNILLISSFSQMVSNEKDQKIISKDEPYELRRMLQ